MSNETINKLYELKGIISAAENLVNHDSEFDHPLIEEIAGKMREVIGMIENEK
ncbi:hypothetical protein [Niallia sp. 03133]|uniref:hypothetical protein n=1 Tax=Niallia sp. 03133 TaxID=3458060 RepID=UPI004044274C